MHILRKLSVPPILSRAGIDEAFIEAHQRILLGGMKRFSFATAAFDSPDLRNLAPLHLFEHRVRGPLIAPLLDKMTQTIDADEWARSVSEINIWLDQMLLATDRVGGRELVARSLKLDTARDSQELADLGARHREFFRRCIRGRLGSAIDFVVAPEFPAADRDDALRLIGHLLLYFNCFSIQLVAARAWWVDHLPFRTDIGPGPYRIAALVSDTANAAAVINGIGAYMVNEQARHPNRAIVTALKPQAREWRNRYEFFDR